MAGPAKSDFLLFFSSFLVAFWLFFRLCFGSFLIGFDRFWLLGNAFSALFGRLPNQIQLPNVGDIPTAAGVGI